MLTLLLKQQTVQEATQEAAPQLSYFTSTGEYDVENIHTSVLLKFKEAAAEITELEKCEDIFTSKREIAYLKNKFNTDEYFEIYNIAKTNLQNYINYVRQFISLPRYKYTTSTCCDNYVLSTVDDITCCINCGCCVDTYYDNVKFRTENNTKRDKIMYTQMASLQMQAKNDDCVEDIVQEITMILNESSTSRKISKYDIYSVCKKIKYKKLHNIHKIHNLITGIEPLDYTANEKILQQDTVDYLKVYSLSFPSRNAQNIFYILAILLNKHNVVLYKYDWFFLEPKIKAYVKVTIDIFQKLDWVYTPLKFI